MKKLKLKFSNSSGIILVLILLFSTELSQNIDRSMAANGSAQIYSCSSEKCIVNLSPVFEVLTNQGTAYRVSFSYKFHKRSKVFIKGLGFVSADSKLNYITYRKEIEFLKSHNGPSILKVPLENPIRLMGKKSIEFPDKTKFPETYRLGRWSHKSLFSENLFKVIDNTFPSGYRAYEENQRNYLISTYNELSGLQNNLYAQIALMISYIANADPQNLDFQVYFKTRERRSHTEWRDEIGYQTKNVVEKFVSKILDNLQEEIL